jgi:hypothetical protein
MPDWVLCPLPVSGIMRGLMRRIQTEEEKAAKKLATIVSDVRLDLDEVGSHLANLPNVAYRRLSEVVDSAEDEKEGKYDRENFSDLY